MATELCRIMAKHGSDKSPLWKGKRKPHNYTPLYDQWFSKWRDVCIAVLECGIYNGGSLRGWEAYFRFGIIHGVDIDVERLFATPNITSISCDQTKQSDVAETLTDLNETYKIIIDDGLHKPEGAIPFFTEAFPYLAKDGYYIVEDVKPKYLKETVLGMKAAHPSAHLTIHNLTGNPPHKYDDILIVARHGVS